MITEITPEKTIEAYKKTGTVPRRSVFYNPKSKECCALTVNVMAEHPGVRESIKAMVDSGLHLPGSYDIRDGVLRHYVDSRFNLTDFESGFDIESEAEYQGRVRRTLKLPSPEFRLGFEVGQAVFEWWNGRGDSGEREVSHTNAD
jgi:hypothetical protein